MGLAAFLVLAELTAGSPMRGGAMEVDLATFAAASPRPRECLERRGSTSAVAPWDRARHPGTRVFCSALARGYAALAMEPAEAVKAAAAAHKVLPGRSEPLVLEGRALVKLGRYDEALQKLTAAQKLAPSSLNAPEALHALGVAAFRIGQHDVALAAYRALAPRLGLVDDPAVRQRAYVEAAALAMRRGTSGLDEAIGYLYEARRIGGLPGLSDYVVGALALALDRANRTEEARGVASTADGPWQLVRDGEEAAARAGRVPNLPSGDLDAMAAILAEPRDPELARQHWDAFLEAQPNGPFAEHARRKLASLKGRR